MIRHSLNFVQFARKKEKTCELPKLLITAGENTVSTLGRAVLIIWLFVVLIINSSYTASLTSILTVQKLSSPIKGIQSLLSTNEPIGYQQGSFSKNYLINELSIHESRLIPLTTPDEYEQALRKGPSNGGVAAVIDERAYVEIFLSTRCEFSIVGQEFTKTAWGFVSIYFNNICIFYSTIVTKSDSFINYCHYYRLFNEIRL